MPCARPLLSAAGGENGRPCGREGARGARSCGLGYGGINAHFTPRCPGGAGPGHPAGSPRGLGVPHPAPRGSGQGAARSCEGEARPRGLPAKAAMCLEGRGMEGARGAVRFMVSAGTAGRVDVAEKWPKDTGSFGKKRNGIG